MNFYSFLQLIRYKKLFFLTITLIVIKYGFINVFTYESSLNVLHFLFLLFSIIFIAAAGFIIKDIFDTEIDSIKKPKQDYVGTIFTLNQSYNFYLTFNIIGVFLGFYLANYLNHPILASIPIVVSFLLYFYGKTLKKLPIIGNILVAFLISLSVLTLAFIDLILIKNDIFLGFHYLLFDLLVDFSIFAFLINFINEIIKNIEKKERDKSLYLNTLPIIIGVKYSKIIVGFTTLFLYILIIFFMISYLKTNPILLFYFAITICLPLLYFIFKLIIAKEKSDFKFLSNLLKIIMLTGTFSILFSSISIQNVF